MSDHADLLAPQFTDEDAAIAHVEASRWPVEVTCPYCGSDNVTRMGGRTQAGYFMCNGCRDKFTCRTRTVMERSHIPVHKWLLAIHLLNSSKKGMSAHQLHRMLGVTYKSAWFLAHRIREAMKDDKPAPMGTTGGAVQADETYYGNTSKRAKGYKKGHSYKAQVIALVDQDRGHVRAFQAKSATADDVRTILFPAEYILVLAFQRILPQPANAAADHLHWRKMPWLAPIFIGQNI
jgi:transposase-like protein